MKPRTAAVGIIACVLVVAAFDVPAGGEDPGGYIAPAPRTPTALHCMVKPRAVCQVGLKDRRMKVANVEDCARIAGLPAPARICAHLPCGWVINASCGMPGGPPCWRAVCEVPFEKRER
jgi:hypothetical protein